MPVFPLSTACILGAKEDIEVVFFAFSICSAGFWILLLLF